jgi:hypothetical protein
MPLATCMKSRFGFERFGMAQSCHGFSIGGKSCGNHIDPLPARV